MTESQRNSLKMNNRDATQALFLVVFFASRKAKAHAQQSASRRFKVKGGSTGTIAHLGRARLCRDAS
jgi:hypothetical protein